MRFRELDWRVLPADDASGRGQLFMKLARSNGTQTGHVALSTRLRRELNIRDAVQLLVSVHGIAVRPADKGAPDQRKVSSTGQLSATNLVCTLLQFAPGESIRLSAVIEDGHAWAQFPPDLAKRMRGDKAA